MANARNNFTRPYYGAGFTGWFRGLFSGSVVSHPGTVVGSWETANVVGSFKTANVTFDTETANVVGTFKTALLTIETETATLYANVEPLQES